MLRRLRNHEGRVSIYSRIFIQRAGLSGRDGSSAASPGSTDASSAVARERAVTKIPAGGALTVDDALGKKVLAVGVRQCPFVSFHPRCSCPPRAALAPTGNSRWGLAKTTVKIDKNGHERTPTEKSKTGRRMLNQPVSSRTASSFAPIPSNERMQSAVLHSPVGIPSVDARSCGSRTTRDAVRQTSVAAARSVSLFAHPPPPNKSATWATCSRATMRTARSTTRAP